MTDIITTLKPVTDLVTPLIKVVTDNSILVAFFASGLIGIAINIIRKLKRA